MATLFLQQLSALILLTFGILCLRVGKRIPDAPAPHRGGWIVTGHTFTLMGVVATVHDLFADWAFFAGEGTRVMDGYLRWYPVGNDGREVLSIGFPLVMLFTIASAGMPRANGVARVTFWNLLLLAVGMGVGVAEQAHTFEQHAGWVSYLQTFSVMVLLGSLLFALVKDRLDALLWVLLTFYAFREAVMVSLASGYSLGGLADGWHPSGEVWQWILVSTNLLFCLTAWIRLVAADRGREVPALLELQNSVGLSIPRA